MKSASLKSLFAVVTVVGFAAQAVAADYVFDTRPRVMVRPNAVVKGNQILLGDVATISATEPEFAALVKDLNEINLGDAPPPRTKTGIPGAKILSMIEAKGIQAETIAYSIPQVVQVERAGRVLQPEELMGEIRDTLSRDNRLDVQVREVLWESSQVLPVGLTTFEVERLGEPSAGKIPLRNVQYLEKVIELCKARGIKLVFVTAPLPPTSWNTSRWNCKTWRE